MKHRYDFLTLFPELFQAFFNSSLIGKARAKGIFQAQTHQIRDFATDRHRTVDESPYGGGEGMVLKADVLFKAWSSVAPADVAEVAQNPSRVREQRNPDHPSGDQRRFATVFVSPQGVPLTQELSQELSQYEHLVFVCGHYEAVDERFIDVAVDYEISIGDYVLTGGELPAMVIADSVIRLLPGTVQNPKSLTEETFEGGLLKYPQYTRPQDFLGRKVPDVLLSGDHGAIAAFRLKERLLRTRVRRPDLWSHYLHTLSKPPRDEA